MAWLVRCRDTRKHSSSSIEVGIDQVDQQTLMYVLLVVDAVLFHHSFEVRLEHSGHLNRELLDAQRGVLGRFLLALLALLDRIDKVTDLFMSSQVMPWI